MLERARVFIRADSAGICLHPTGEDLLRSLGKRSVAFRAGLRDPPHNPACMSTMGGGGGASPNLQTNLTLDHLRVPSSLSIPQFPPRDIPPVDALSFRISGLARIYKPAHCPEQLGEIVISEFGESHSGLLASERNELEPSLEQSLFYLALSSISIERG